MKFNRYLIFLSFFLLIWNVCFAADDSLYVEVNNDTLFVHNANVWEQCGFKLDYYIEITDSIITITQIDTAFDMTTCYGYHHFVFPIQGLEDGNFRVDVYRKSWGQDLRFIDSLKFNLPYSSIWGKDNPIQVKNHILYPAYPNPFNPKTRLTYYLADYDEIEIIVYDSIGRTVEVLFRGIQTLGTHDITFSGNSLSSGVYFVNLKSKTSSHTIKILLMK